jgi:polyhydroxybutyrate depolymerase
MRHLPPLVVALVLVLSACSGGDDENSDPTADLSPAATAVPTAATGCSPSRPANAGDSRRTLAVNGEERSYILHVPPSYDGNVAIPLVVVFPGFGLTAEFMAGYTLFGEKADEQNFVVAYPEAAAETDRWNTTKAINVPDDVAFGTALLDSLEDELCVNADAVFLAGFSDGGGMAQQLACSIPDRIAGLGTVASMYVSCRESVPWAAFHGMEDPVAPFTGGERPPEDGGGTSLDARRTLSDWSRELGCDPLGQISHPNEGVELTTFPNCLLGSGEVLLYTIIEGGHTWPGAAALPVETAGATSQQISATDTMWDFFEARGAQTAGAEDNGTAD